jgi:phosphatidylserine synthase
MVIVMLRYEDISGALPLHLYLPVLMFVLAILMVSRIRFPKAVWRKSKFINAFQIVNSAAIVYCGVFRKPGIKHKRVKLAGDACSID